MKPGRNSRRSLISSKKLVIRTTFFDLVSRLSDLAKDEAALVASVRRVLEGCNVRMVNSMAPVRVSVEARKPATLRKAGGSQAVWA